jgi:WXG100 family type VII secretion target
MPQAVVDPDELRRFAARLKKFNNDLQNQASVLGGQLAALGSTWRDQEHQKFVEQFEQHMKMIARFTEASEQYVPYLMRKAEHIEDYLQK